MLDIFAGFTPCDLGGREMNVLTTLGLYAILGFAVYIFFRYKSTANLKSKKAKVEHKKHEETTIMLSVSTIIAGLYYAFNANSGILDTCTENLFAANGIVVAVSGFLILCFVLYRKLKPFDDK